MGTVAVSLCPSVSPLLRVLLGPSHTRGRGCHEPAAPWALPASRHRFGVQQDGDLSRLGCWLCRCNGARRRGPKVPRAQPHPADPAQLMICLANELGGAQGFGGTLSRPLARYVGLHPLNHHHPPPGRGHGSQTGGN